MCILRVLPEKTPLKYGAGTGWGRIQVLTEIQPLVAEDAEMAVLAQQTISKMQQLNEQQFRGLELEWYKPEETNKKTEVAEK